MEGNKSKHRKERKMKEKKMDNEDVKFEEEGIIDTIEIIELQRKLEEKELECIGNLDKYQRNMAEFDNFRKRTMKEKSEMYDIGVMETVGKILPMIDNFERAIEQISKDINEEETKNYSILKGIKMIYEQFNDTIKGIGVQEIEALNKPFDTSIHNAVMHVEDENYGENEVIEVFQKGYTYGEKVMRHAMVKVAN
ncbi:MAG: nucleotide exchange factor GrpE [Clostridiales bacterium GWD2_32_19]|nr:MAG: nucleotide exchange factor GrpE [Clostridiales bacterium GWD2_32_19]